MDPETLEAGSKVSALLKGMIPGDFSCLTKCKAPHERYSKGVHLAISEDAKALKLSAAKVNEAVASQHQKYLGQIVQCSAYMEPIKAQQGKYLEALELMKDKMPAYEQRYERDVVACARRCGPDAEAGLKEALPREKLHRIWKDHFDNAQAVPVMSACVGTAMKVL